MSSAVTISPDDFARFLRDLKDEFEPAMKRGVLSGAQRCIPLLQARTANAKPASPNGGVGAVDTGMLKAAWKAEARQDGASVYNARPYSPVVEFGRRAGPVSKEGKKMLAKWAQRKLHLSESEAKSAAFAIARSLGKRPLKAREIVSGGEKEMTKLVLEEVEHELEKTLRGER